MKIQINAAARLRAADDNGDQERLGQLVSQIKMVEEDVKEIEEDGDDATVERKHLESLRDEQRRLKEKMGIKASTQMQAGKNDAAILKYLSGAVTQKLTKADISRLTYKVAGGKMTLRGFGNEAIISQKALDRYSSITFTVADIKSYLEANGAKPIKGAKPRAIYE